MTVALENKLNHSEMVELHIKIQTRRANKLKKKKHRTGWYSKSQTIFNLCLKENNESVINYFPSKVEN